MKTLIVIIASLFNHHSESFKLDGGQTVITMSTTKITVKSDYIEPKELIHYLDKVFIDRDVQYYNIDFQTHGKTLRVKEVPYSRVAIFK